MSKHTDRGWMGGLYAMDSYNVYLSVDGCMDGWIAACVKCLWRIRDLKVSVDMVHTR